MNLELKLLRPVAVIKYYQKQIHCSWFVHYINTVFNLRIYGGLCALKCEQRNNLLADSLMELQTSHYVVKTKVLLGVFHLPFLFMLNATQHGCNIKKKKGK